MYERKDYLHEILRSKDFSGRVLENVDFSFSYLENCNFKGSRLIGCNFKGSIIKNCCFDCCYIEHTSFSDARNDYYKEEEKKCMEERKPYKTVHTPCEIINTNFRNCCMWKGIFGWVMCTNVDFSGSYIVNNISFCGTWKFSRFVSTKMFGINSRGLYLLYCKFINTHFGNFISESSCLTGSIFKGIRPHGKELRSYESNAPVQFLKIFLGDIASDLSVNNEKIYFGPNDYDYWDDDPWIYKIKAPRMNIEDFGTTKWAKEIEHLERKYELFNAENPLPKVSKKLKEVIRNIHMSKTIFVMNRLLFWTLQKVL